MKIKRAKKIKDTEIVIPIVVCCIEGQKMSAFLDSKSFLFVINF
ncbi:hypothetical protein Pf1_01126 [Flavobacterium columnare]|nr:hypothetical protein Pf1_01126 [Flavobacterium columnare]